MRRCQREGVPWPRRMRGESVGDPVRGRATAVLLNRGTAHYWQRCVVEGGRVTMHDPVLLFGESVAAHLRERVALPGGD